MHKMENEQLDTKEMKNVRKTIDKLPDEILKHIFEHLALRDWLPVRATCKRFHDVIENNVISRKTFKYYMIAFPPERFGFLCLFGKKMTRIDIEDNRAPWQYFYSYSFNDALRLILTYCQPRKLIKAKFKRFSNR